jgi:hypothetical protein
MTYSLDDSTDVVRYYLVIPATTDAAAGVQPRRARAQYRGEVTKRTRRHFVEWMPEWMTCDGAHAHLSQPSGSIPTGGMDRRGWIRVLALPVPRWRAMMRLTGSGGALASRGPRLRQTRSATSATRPMGRLWFVIDFFRCCRGATARRCREGWILVGRWHEADLEGERGHVPVIDVPTDLAIVDLADGCSAERDRLSCSSQARSVSACASPS